jgi:hypothetical protein
VRDGVVRRHERRHLVHSFDVFEQSAPHAQWLGAQVEPGQTATLTVRFTAKGTYMAFCGEPEHSEDYGETGLITVG